MLDEQEATLLGIVFEEVGAYQYKKNKEAERNSGVETGGDPVGLKPGFDEVFSFGETDQTDYLHFKDDGVDIID